MNIFTTILIQPLTNGLIFFYTILGGNLGLAIIAFSLFLRLALSPLTKPYMESVKKMKQYAPQLAKIKNRHKGNRQKQAQAQSEFYKQKGINPGAGCLPYLLQIVILIALFNVFSRVLSSNGDLTERLNELLYAPLKLAEGLVVDTKFLYLDLTRPDAIPIAGLPFPIPGPVILLAAALQVVTAMIMKPYVDETKKVAAKTKEVKDDFQAAFQSSATYMFPLFTIIFGMQFASGLALYWLTFSLFQAYQQYRMTGWGGATPWVRKLKEMAKLA